MYLLVNSGYLTARKRGGMYYFRIPNSELRDEFKNKIEERIKYIERNTSGTDYSEEYLDFLQKWHAKLKDHTKTIRAIKAMQNNDLDSLEQTFALKGKIECGDKDTNFNLFHIAALSDEGVFRLVLEYCD
jgi:transcriptional regulator CtsR